MIVENPHPSTRGNWDAGIAARQGWMIGIALITSGPKEVLEFWQTPTVLPRHHGWLKAHCRVQDGLSGENMLYIFIKLKVGSLLITL